MALALIASACAAGGATAAAVVYRDAEQVRIKPENLAHPTTTSPPLAVDTEAPLSSESASSPATTTSAPADTTTTIPLNADTSDPVDGVFAAMKIFNDCLKDNGTSFIGIPTAGGDPQAPVNDSQYIADLIECAAVSQIQGAFQTLQSANDNVPADEIETRNRGLVKWADCLKGRGWKLDPLTPDARGLLQISQDMTPPNGESILESDDLQECREIATADLEAETP